jgi:hypothetical protein
MQYASSNVNEAEIPGTYPFRKPYKRGSPVILDPYREVQLKLLIGGKGEKHGRLPDVVSLGYIWFIPAFEAHSWERNGTFSWRGMPISGDGGGRSEIDFFKKFSEITEVEVDWEWESAERSKKDQDQTV